MVEPPAQPGVKEPEVTEHPEEPVGEKPDLDVPSQTPYFHAIERARYTRQQQIREIEQFAGRRLIVFVSAPWAEITHDVITVFGDLLEDLDEERGDNLDLLLNTPGGDIDTAEKLVMMCRARCDGFRVIVPESAKSAGTLMACAADSIVMGYASELGPIDPQITVPGGDGTFVTRPAHAYLSGLEEIKQAAAKEGGLNPAYFPLLQGLDPALLEYCRTSIRRAEEFARKWLTNYQCNGDEKLAGEIAKKLGDVETFRSHGAAIDADEATKMGLQIEKLEPKDVFWQATWRLWCEYDLQLRQQNLRHIFEGHRASVVWPG